jgi:hypothetical protein
MQSDWVKSLRVLLGRAMEIKPALKGWRSFRGASWSELG